MADGRRLLACVCCTMLPISTLIFRGRFLDKVTVARLKINRIPLISTFCGQSESVQTIAQIVSKNKVWGIRFILLAMTINYLFNRSAKCTHDVPFFAPIYNKKEMGNFVQRFTHGEVWYSKFGAYSPAMRVLCLVFRALP